jgi:hypothetical protein
MKNYFYRCLRYSGCGTLLGILMLFIPDMKAQDNSVVLIHADKSSGYGVAWGGPQNNKDMIVTALHLVAGKKTIQVVWKGKTSTARVEKIYKPSDLALLKLTTPLGIPPMGLYSGEPPWDTNINFWEFPAAATAPTKKTTILEGRSSLASISPLIENEPAGLSKALCNDAGQSYPNMNTAVINFKEANIRKAHSGSPLTYGDKILGMVDGGARLVGGKPCVWAIPAADFNKLLSQGTVPSETMVACNAPGTENKYMYSGIRTDNPLLSPEEVIQAEMASIPMNFSTSMGRQLELLHNYTMSFQDVYETLFEEEKQYLLNLFHPGDNITLDDLLKMTVNLYTEEKTGVSVMIPSQCTLTNSTDGFGTLNTTTSPGGSVKMSFYISQGESMNDGMTALNSFKEFIQNNGQAIEPIDDEQLKRHNKYYSEYFEKKSNDQRGNTRAVFFADLIINDGDFLAVTLTASDWGLVAKNPEEKLYFYLMEICTILSDFAIY